MHQKKYIFIVILIFVNLNESASAIRFNPERTVNTFYYGSTYRFDGYYRNVISFDSWKLNEGCIGGDYRGYGFDLEWSSDLFYSTGFRFFHSIFFNEFRTYPLPYLGFHSSFFLREKTRGISITPEIGFHEAGLFNFSRLNLDLVYGYDLPVFFNNEKFYNGGHRLTLKIGFDI